MLRPPPSTRLVMAAVLLVSMGMATAQVGAADNLLTNPGAEEGSGGWRTFSEVMPGPQQSDGGMSFALNEIGTVFSEEYFPVEDGTTFEVAAKVAFESPEQGGVVYVGLAPYDADKQPIKAAEVHVVADTVTELAQDAARGQTLLRLQDGAAWVAAFDRDSLLERNGVVAFDVSAEGLGDLPNRNLSASGLKVISRDGGWEVELAKPLERDWPAGTKVRLHYATATYCYVGSAPASPDWKDVTGSFLSPVEGDGVTAGHLWPGTRYVRFVVLSTRNGNDHPGRVFFDDLSLTAFP
jgi:hypothetical protein